MSKDDKNEQEEVKQDGKVQIRWDGSKMRSTYANVTNVSSTREEMTLLFGTNKSWHNAHKELTVELSDRMILNPFAAKRLSVLLANVVDGYEEQFGIIELEVPAPPDSDGEPATKH